MSRWARCPWMLIDMSLWGMWGNVPDFMSAFTPVSSGPGLVVCTSEDCSLKQVSLLPVWLPEGVVSTLARLLYYVNHIVCDFRASLCLSLLITTPSGSLRLERRVGRWTQTFTFSHLADALSRATYSKYRYIPPEAIRVKCFAQGPNVIFHGRELNRQPSD